MNLLLNSIYTCKIYIYVYIYIYIYIYFFLINANRCGQSKFERFVEGSDLLQVPSEMQQVRTNKNCGVPNRENITSINEMELLFNTFRRNMNSSAMFTMVKFYLIYYH